MSFTYSVTAWGFEASRASTSSALRSDLSGFLPASAATESPALVMSPKTARLVRVAMGVLFSSLGAALCKRGARGGAAGDGEEKTGDRGAGATTTGGDGAQNEEGDEAPAMAAASDSECEASTSARQIGRVAGGKRGQTKTPNRSAAMVPRDNDTAVDTSAVFVRQES